MRRFLGSLRRQSDPILLALCSAATAFGLVMIASATRYLETRSYVLIQLVAAAIGVGAYMLFSALDVRELSGGWKWLTLAGTVLIALLFTPLGVGAGGNRAWISIPGVPVNLQPAEPIKLLFIMVLARQLAWMRQEKTIPRFRRVLLPVGHLLGLTGLYYAASGDMGSTLVYVVIFLCMAYAAGVKGRWFALAGALAGAGCYALWKADVIRPYMKDRFLILLDREMDPLGVGWHQNRSLLALGSGGLTGQGLFRGTQTQSEYSNSLPARHTDFIFSAIGEELGMIGCVAVLLLLSAIVIRCFVAAYHAKTPLETYVCVGVAATLMFQTAVNVGMCLFLMPVIGLTLPFVSYGGSSLVALFAAAGMVSGIHKRSLPERLR